NANAHASSLSIQMAVTLLDLDFPNVTAETKHETSAFIGQQADIEVIGGGLSGTAYSHNTAHSGGAEIAIGIADIDIAEASAKASGKTSAYVGEGAVVAANTLGVTATSDNDASAFTFSTGQTLASIRKASVETTVDHLTEAYLGRLSGRDPDLAGSLTVASG